MYVHIDDRTRYILKIFGICITNLNKGVLKKRRYAYVCAGRDTLVYSIYYHIAKLPTSYSLMFCILRV
jgi:hypothetical protein